MSTEAIPQHNSMMQTISQYFGWNLTAVTSWLAGTGAGSVVAMQIPNGQREWWQEPAVVSAAVVALIMFLKHLLDKYLDGKKEKRRRDDDLQTQKEEFWKEQLTIKHLSEFEARMRAHRFGNELNRVCGHVFILHSLMSDKKIQIPDFALKSAEELMHGLDDEVNRFRESLAERHNHAIHKTSDQKP